MEKGNAVESGEYFVRSVLKKANANHKYEVETRFGTFNNDTFFPSLTYNTHYDFLNRMEKTTLNKNLIIGTVTIDIFYIVRNKKESIKYRKTIDALGVKPNYYTIKEKKIIADDKENGMRLSMNLENEYTEEEFKVFLLDKQMDIKKENFQHARHKNRMSIINGHYSYDFTLVFTLQKTEINGVNAKEKDIINAISIKPNTVPPIPEFELEYIGNKLKDIKKSSFTEYNNHIINVITTINESLFPITIPKKKDVNDKINNLMKKYKIKLSKPITLTPGIHKKINKREYAVTPKADGERVLLFIINQEVFLVFHETDRIINTGIAINEPKLNNTLIDGEYTINVITGYYTFLGFDAIIIGDEDVRKKDLIKRITHVRDVITFLSIFETENTIKVRAKIYREDYQDLKLFYQSDYLEYNIDGVVFVPKNKGYLNNQIYKWKPREENTIDFYVELQNYDDYTYTFDLYVSTKKETSDKTLYFKKMGKLFHLVNKNEIKEKNIIREVYIKKFKGLQATVFKDILLNGNQPMLSASVVEFKILLDENNILKGLEPVSVRWDKYYKAQPGNFETFAEQAWESSVKGITFEDLLGHELVINPNPGEKERKASEMYRLRRFHNWVKASILKDVSIIIPYKHNLEILDMASGRGGDIHKYSQMGNVSLVVGFDIDEESVKEANKRAQEAQLETPLYIFKVLDLSKNLVYNNMKKMGMEGNFHLVTNFFALHYFFKSQSNLEMLLRNASENLVKGGYFVGTCFDKNHVGTLLHKTEKGSKFIGPNYTITKHYENKDLEKSPYGNKISVEMKGTVYFDGKTNETIEYLVDFEEMIKLAPKYGLKFVSVKPFEKLYEIYHIDNIMNKPQNANLSLDHEEKLISYLNVGFIFEKVTYSKLELTQLELGEDHVQKTINDSNRQNEEYKKAIHVYSESSVNSNVQESPPMTPKPKTKKKPIDKDIPEPPKYARKPYCIQDISDGTVDAKFLKLVELKDIAKEIKIKGYTKMNKEDLCKALKFYLKN